jgi:hypothetical protein
MPGQPFDCDDGNFCTGGLVRSRGADAEHELLEQCTVLDTGSPREAGTETGGWSLGCSSEAVNFSGSRSPWRAPRTLAEIHIAGDLPSSSFVFHLMSRTGPGTTTADTLREGNVGLPARWK